MRRSVQKGRERVLESLKDLRCLVSVTSKTGVDSVKVMKAFGMACELFKYLYEKYFLSLFRTEVYSSSC